MVAKRELNEMQQALRECAMTRKKKRAMYEDLLERALYICDHDYNELQG